MKKPSDGTEQSKDFVVEVGPAWSRWARRRTDAELAEVRNRLEQLKEGFGKPHVHAGAGIRRLSPRVLEFRISRGLRVVFLFVKPRTFRLMMIGNHDEVRAWLKENA